MPIRPPGLFRTRELARVSRRHDTRPVDIPETRFAWNGDISLAYQVLGEGPDLLYLPGGVSNVEIMWESTSFSDLLRGLPSFSRLIVMDRGGPVFSARFPPNRVPPP